MKKIIIILLVISTNIIQAQAMPNPASSYCTKHGGTLDLSNFSIGICKFSDGSECEEWAFYNKKCKPGTYRDWIKEKENKNHVLKLSIAESGFIKSNKNLPLLSLSKEIVNPQYKEKEDSNFLYKKIVVQDINQFATRKKSNKFKVKLLIDNDIVKEYKFNGLNYYDKYYLYLYTPINDKKKYEIKLEVNSPDEKYTILSKKKLDPINIRNKEVEKTKTNIVNIIYIFIKSIFTKIF